jgi:hypothetical protein
MEYCALQYIITTLYVIKHCHYISTESDYIARYAIIGILEILTHFTCTAKQQRICEYSHTSYMNNRFN